MTVVSQINGIENRKHDICRDDFALRHPKSAKKSAKKCAVACDTPHQAADYLLKMFLNDQLQLIAKAGEQ